MKTCDINQINLLYPLESDFVRFTTIYHEKNLVEHPTFDDFHKDKNPHPDFRSTSLGIFVNFFMKFEIHTQPTIPNTPMLKPWRNLIYFEFCARKPNMKSLPKKVYKN